MSEAITPAQAPEAQSPPPADEPPRQHRDEPRQRLFELAAELVRSQNRHVLAEFLRLRRSLL